MPTRQPQADAADGREAEVRLEYSHRPIPVDNLEAGNAEQPTLAEIAPGVVLKLWIEENVLHIVAELDGDRLDTGPRAAHAPRIARLLDGLTRDANQFRRDLNSWRQQIAYALAESTELEAEDERHHDRRD